MSEERKAGERLLFKCTAFIIGALLALVSSAAAITFVLRYNPLEILAERD